MTARLSQSADTIVARDAGMYNRLRLALILDDENRDRYRRFGSYYELGVEQGFEALGSDYESTIVEFFCNANENRQQVRNADRSDPPIPTS